MFNRILNSEIRFRIVSLLLRIRIVWLLETIRILWLLKKDKFTVAEISLLMLPKRPYYNQNSTHESESAHQLTSFDSSVKWFYFKTVILCNLNDCEASKSRYKRRLSWQLSTVCSGDDLDNSNSWKPAIW